MGVLEKKSLKDFNFFKMDPASEISCVAKTFIFFTELYVANAFSVENTEEINGRRPSSG